MTAIYNMNCLSGIPNIHIKQGTQLIQLMQIMTLIKETNEKIVEDFTKIYWGDSVICDDYDEQIFKKRSEIIYLFERHQDDLRIATLVEEINEIFDLKKKLLITSEQKYNAAKKHLIQKQHDEEKEKQRIINYIINTYTLNKNPEVIVCEISDSDDISFIYKRHMLLSIFDMLYVNDDIAAIHALVDICIENDVFNTHITFDSLCEELTLKYYDNLHNFTHTQFICNISTLSFINLEIKYKIRSVADVNTYSLLSNTKKKYIFDSFLKSLFL